MIKTEKIKKDKNWKDKNLINILSSTNNLQRVHLSKQNPLKVAGSRVSSFDFLFAHKIELTRCSKLTIPNS